MNGEQIRGYSVEMNDLGIGYPISRVVTLIHLSLNYTRRKDLEQNYIAAIVCDVKLPNKSNFTIISQYRQWNLPRDINIVNKLDNNQCTRYQNYVQMCENILKRGNDTLIIGDDNIDSYNNYNNCSNNKDM